MNDIEQLKHALKISRENEEIIRQQCFKHQDDIRALKSELDALKISSSSLARAVMNDEMGNA